MEKCLLPGCEELSRRSYQERDGRRVHRTERFCYSHSGDLKRLNLPSTFRYSDEELQALARVLEMMNTEPLKARRWEKKNPSTHGLGR